MNQLKTIMNHSPKGNRQIVGQKQGNILGYMYVIVKISYPRKRTGKYRLNNIVFQIELNLD